jgi:rubredoxin
MSEYEVPEWFCLLCGAQFDDERGYDRHIFPPGQEFTACVGSECEEPEDET